MNSPAVSTRARMPSVALGVAGGLLIALAVGVRVNHQRQARPEHAVSAVPAAQLSIAALIDQLGQEAHSASAARDALIARLGSDALPLFVRLLDHPRASTRALAVEGATDLAGRSSARDESSTAAGPRLARALRERLADYDALVRLRVVEGIRRVDRAAALPILLGALRDEDEWLREAAARQLGDLRARESVAALITGLDDLDPNVVSLCAGALRRITRQPIRYRYAAAPEEQRRAVAMWKQWWAARCAAWTAPPPAASTMIRMSAAAPPLEARDMTGKLWRTADLRDRVVLLNFLGSWCYPCAKELPGLAHLQRRYAVRGLRVIGLGVAEESEADLRRFAERQRLPFPVAIAPEGVLEAYGDIHEVPVSFLIDRRGQIRRIWEGDRTEQTFEAGIRRMLEEQP